jgi:hypothetical protein
VVSEPCSCDYGRRNSSVSVSEALSKLKEDCKAENQRASKLADSFKVQQDALAKLQAENKAFQSWTEETLHVIMETLANKASEHVAGKVIEHGETSGEHSTFTPPTGEGETAIPKVTVEGEMSAPNPNNSFIPSATDGGGINPRSVNLDFPKFDGSDPTNWVLKAQQFFVFGQIQDNQRVPISYFHMEGKALQWYNWLMESGSVRSWEEFVVALKVRFAPSAYDDPVGAFTKLQQLSTVDEYQSQFEVLSNGIPGLTEEFRVSSFISGLKEEVQIMVTMLQPTTLPNAFGLARLQE